MFYSLQNILFLFFSPTNLQGEENDGGGKYLQNRLRFGQGRLQGAVAGARVGTRQVPAGVSATNLGVTLGNGSLGVMLSVGISSSSGYPWVRDRLAGLGSAGKEVINPLLISMASLRK